MLSAEGNAGERWKTTIGLISKKSNSACAAHFFCTFLCRCFTRQQRETSTNFLVKRCMEEMSYVFSFTFFSLPLIFTLHWSPLAFLILSPPLQNRYKSEKTRSVKRARESGEDEDYEAPPPFPLPMQFTTLLASLADFLPVSSRFLPFSPTTQPGPRLML